VFNAVSMGVVMGRRWGRVCVLGFAIYWNVLGVWGQEFDRWQLILGGALSYSSVYNRGDFLNQNIIHEPEEGWPSQGELLLSYWWDREVGIGWGLTTTNVSMGYEGRDTALSSDTFFYSTLSFGYPGIGMELLLSTRTDVDIELQKGYLNFGVGLYYHRYRFARYQSLQYPPSDPVWMERVFRPSIVTLRMRLQWVFPMTERLQLVPFFTVTRSLTSFENLDYIRAHWDGLPHAGYVPPFGVFKRPLSSPSELDGRAPTRFWILTGGLGVGWSF